MLQRTLNLLNQLMIPIHSDWMLYCKKLVFKDCKWNIIDILEKKSAVRSNANINFHIHLEDPAGLAPFSMLSCLEYTPVKSRKDCSYPKFGMNNSATLVTKNISENHCLDKVQVQDSFLDRIQLNSVFI